MVWYFFVCSRYHRFDRGLFSYPRYIYNLVDDEGERRVVCLDLASASTIELMVAPQTWSRQNQGFVVLDGRCLAFAQDRDIILVSLKTGEVLAKVGGANRIVKTVQGEEASADHLCYAFCTESLTVFELCSGR